MTPIHTREEIVRFLAPWILGTFVFLGIGLYTLAVHETVFAAVAWKEAESRAAALQNAVAELESRAAALQEQLTLESARAEGYVVAYANSAE